MDDSTPRHQAATTIWTRVKKLAARFAREPHAGPIVEFAIIVPVLLLLLLGIIDIAFGYFRMTSLVAAVREGARAAAVQSEPCLDSWQDSTKRRVRQYFNPGVNKPSDTLTSAMITVSARNAADAVISAAGCPAVTRVRVEIPAYSYSPINPAFRLINQTGGFSFRPVRAEFRWERSP